MKLSRRIRDIAKDKARVIHLIAALLLTGLFLFPLWQIRLEAPQYPEGIAMYIWLNKITGSDPNTLNSINILNHYIGMQRITPESIPELKYFPYAAIFLIVTGVLVFLINKKSLRLTWLIVLAVLTGLGIFDFYLWEYNFGHNLDPNAPIKVPGMVYQPPLIGAKRLLNFNAFSFPHLGGILMALSIIIAALACLAERGLFKKRLTPVGSGGLILICFFLQVCKAGPEPIKYGYDSCAFCSMTIVDRCYGTEAVTGRGRILKFDSVECLVEYLLYRNEESKEFRYILITDYTNPGIFTDAKEASYLICESLLSPMGAFLTGFSKKADAEKIRNELGGTLYSWEELIDHLSK